MQWNKWWCVLFAGALALPAWAAGDDVLAHGVKDGAAPAWAVAVASPGGWTRDCCLYARAIGVNAVLYQGEWTGNPERVMVLNVWPRKLATLDAELAADRKRYLQRDPAGKATLITVHNAHMPCQGVVYAGSDHVDDVVVFCDPGAASGVRLSWSMSFADGDTIKRALLDDFMRVAQGARYQHYVAPKAAAR
ncbi:MAG: hypothetical protein EPN56_06075 [Rhodanobacter sp.]|nr:MAG: hypothetical protein EPN78_00740 [Rhodanobacter sp.]TAM10994.1 MAG: hypothetical protein EPN66_09100 [Rhodanobacter sp.]TAM36528.1 MAG: hypothetical protein EPN56_06075 [Rhodanobacter sp.]